jgi:hypothetical protein
MGPTLPLLFNLVVGVLTRMLAKASRNKLVGVLLGQFREGCPISAICW